MLMKTISRKASIRIKFLVNKSSFAIKMNKIAAMI